jgi:hypothetical protein
VNGIWSPPAPSNSPFYVAVWNADDAQRKNVDENPSKAGDPKSIG